MVDERDTAPEASRSQLPTEYGILGPAEGEGLLPWSWAAERLARSRGYWLATTRPDGRPHLAVVWGVWLDDRFYFSTSPASQKAHNLAAHPACVVCLEHADEAITVEGVAEIVTVPALLEQFATAYEAKHHEEADTGQFAVYAVRPTTVFAFVSDAARFPGTATRWRFRTGQATTDAP